MTEVRSVTESMHRPGGVPAEELSLGSRLLDHAMTQLDPLLRTDAALPRMNRQQACAA
jgi:hypothetical protein